MFFKQPGVSELKARLTQLALALDQGILSIRILRGVMPKVSDEGGQERDLTSAGANDAVWQRGSGGRIVLIASRVIQSHRKIPHSVRLQRPISEGHSCGTHESMGWMNKKWAAPETIGQPINEERRRCATERLRIAKALTSRLAPARN